MHRGNRGRILITQSLLSSWNYLFTVADEYADQAYESFLNSLNRVQMETSPAMQNGIDFENLVTDICNNNELEEHKWLAAAQVVAAEVRGGQLQLAAKKEFEVNGINLLLYGRLDCLKAGTIYDIKYTSKYESGKFFKSPQHPMYLELIPEAERFIYLVSNGRGVWRESYTRGETRPILTIIQEFINHMDSSGLIDIFLDKWKCNY